MPRQQLFDEPLTPPIDGQVLRVCRWPEVFETAHSRKHKVLTWISCPVSFNSTGYQRLLDSFDGWEAAALYGAWLALCQLAAQSQLRGRLCGQKGEPYNTRRIARLTGMSVEIFETLIPWALKVSWLEWATPEAPYAVESGGDNDDSDSIPKSGTELDSTQPNPTQPNVTQPNPVGVGGEELTWNHIRRALAECGVTAVSKSVKAAQAACWTVSQAEAVIAHFRSKPNAWGPFVLYERFQQPASVAPGDGWPAESEAYRAAARHQIQRLRDEAAAKERAEHRRRVREERERDGPVKLLRPAALASRNAERRT